MRLLREPFSIVVKVRKWPVIPVANHLENLFSE
jgi:hypothetical protein